MERNYTLSKEQKIATDFAIASKYSILALDVGVGKTLASLHAAFNGGGTKVLVVVPTFLAIQWKTEIKKFFPNKILTMMTNARDYHEPWGTDVVIATYNYIDKGELLFEWADTVICDECHNLKNISSKRGEAIHRLVYEYSMPRVILLSGTLLENRVLELHSPLSLMEYNPRIHESSFLKKFPTALDFALHFSFVEEFEFYKGGKKRVQRKFKGVKNKEELHKILRKHMIVIKNSGLGIDSIDVPVLISDTEDKGLIEEFNNFLLDEDNHRVDVTRKVMSAMAKVKLTADYAKNLNVFGDRPIIIFTDHVDSAKELALLLDVTPITGTTPVNARTTLVNKFNDGDVDYLVATYGALGTGYNLQACCGDMIFNDPPWKNSTLIQAKGRIYRKGQTKRCVFHHIYGSPQDKYISEIINEKRDTNDQAVNELAIKN